MKIIIDFFKGILIGAGAILPGISSGVLCVIFGVYEKLVNSILHFFDNWKKNILFLLPLGFGGIVGVLLLGKLLNYLFANFEIPTKFAFIGFILGSIPVLFKKAKHGSGFRLHYLLYTFIAFLVGFLLIQLEHILPTFIANSSIINSSPIYLAISGFFMSIGVVVPGVSSTVILMCFGVYENYLSAIASMNISFLIPLGIGLVIGGFLFLKVISFLLEKYYIPTYYSIIGFVLGSVLVLYPGFSFTIQGLLAIILFLLSFKIAIMMENLDK